MASDVEIANRALQKLGAARITNLSENSKNARAVNAAFQPVKLALLEEHFWNFSIKRAALAADATPPDWGRSNSFTLPSDFIKLAPPYPEDNWSGDDLQIEQRKIVTDRSAPLYIRYVYNVTDPNDMTALFREVFACKLAVELCEELTQSNTKKEDVEKALEMEIRKAKKSNAFQSVSAEPPEDSFISRRL